MGKPVSDPLAKRCGNCSHWDNSDRKDDAGECCGVPPTPALIGAQPRKFGPGVDFQIEMFRPIMHPFARPCTFHQMVEIPLLGQSGKAKGH